MPGPAARLVFSRSCPLCLISLLLRGWRSGKRALSEWRKLRASGGTADALASGASVRKGVGVQIPPRARNAKNPGKSMIPRGSFVCRPARTDSPGEGKQVSGGRGYRVLSAHGPVPHIATCATGTNVADCGFTEARRQCAIRAERSTAVFGGKTAVRPIKCNGNRAREDAWVKPREGTRPEREAAANWPPSAMPEGLWAGMNVMPACVRRTAACVRKPRARSCPGCTRWGRRTCARPG